MNNYLLRNKQHIIHFVNFIYTYNPGAALCYVTYSCNSITILFLSIISIVAVLIMMFISNINNIIFYAFIIGGALGNISNRIIYGVVIDFIDIYINKLHFPTFNIADYAIFIGTILLFRRIF